MIIGMVTQAVPFLPATDGYRVYTANVLRCLAARHSIHLVAIVSDEDRERLDWARERCASVEFVPAPARTRRSAALSLAAMATPMPPPGSARLSALVRSAAARQHWEILHVEGEYAAGLLPPILPAPAILSLHDSWVLRCRALVRCAAAGREWLRARVLQLLEPGYERRVFRRFDACVVVGEADREAVQNICPDRAVVTIPIGLDTAYYHPQPVEKLPDSFVFHGNLSYPPNVQAACELVRQILPRVRSRLPGAVLQLAGATPSAEMRAACDNPAVRLFAGLPDLRPVLASSMVYACPLRSGTGVKNKILEAMAMGLPIVCTPPALDGIACEPGKHILVADDGEAFAQAVVRLLSSPAEAANLAQRGREFVEASFDWEQRARSFEILYRTVIATRSDTVPGRPFIVRGWRKGGAA